MKSMIMQMISDKMHFEASLQKMVMSLVVNFIFQFNGEYFESLKYGKKLQNHFITDM